MRKFFISISRAFLLGILTLLVIPNSISAQCPDEVIQGRVYLDLSFNGSYDSGEEGVGGVLVQAFGIDGLVYDEAITDSKGLYSLNELIEGENYRVIFNYPEAFSVSYVGPDNGTAVQFLKAPACNASLALLNSSLDCGANPYVFLTCFVRGESGENDDYSTIIGLNYDFNPGSDVDKIATKAETGSIWGLAFSSSLEGVFSSALVKQYAAFTEHGHDAIYFTNTDTKQTSLFAKLSDLGIDAGTLEVNDINDCSYGHQVGRIGLGALEISTDENTLFVSHFYDNTIVKLPINNPNENNVEVIQVPNPGCSNGDYNVFALKYLEGNKMLVGVTCTAETSQDANQSSANIYRLNLEDNSFELIFTTDYLKGYWFDTPSELIRPQQWLSDLEVTEEGNIIMALSDRVGHKYCNPLNQGRLDDQRGDILMVYNDNGTYRLESNGSAGELTGSGVGNGQGPDGGEFFGDDFFPFNDALHPDVAVGSIYLNPKRNDLVAAVFDPMNNTYSGGLHRYDVSDGSKTNAIELYSQQVDVNFGKAVGFGNIVGKCGYIPIEVGNFAWLDENENGLQDVGEVGLQGVRLNIYNNACEKVGSTVTSDSGLFGFNSSNIDINLDGAFDGLVAGEQYFIAIDDSHYNPNTYSYEFFGQDLIPTSFKPNPLINNDLLKDSDLCPEISRLGIVKILSSTTDHSMDIGLATAKNFDLALKKTLVSDFTTRFGEIVTYRIHVVNQGCMIAKEISVIDYITSNYEFDQSLNPDWKFDGTNAKVKIEKLLCPSEELTVDIKLRLVGGDYDKFTNIAEISGAINQFGVPGDDVDSTPDEDPNNDAGGIVNVATDDYLDGNGIDDEDDHDPARVQIVDLSLIKMIRNPGIYAVGDDITFDIEICNQGNETVNYIEINEELVGDLSFLTDQNDGWDYTPNISLRYEINEELVPGQCMIIPVTYKIGENLLTDCIINYSEISDFSAVNPAITQDFDSDPDYDFKNDAGGDVDSGTDNVSDDHGQIDEDDHDPVVVKASFFDLALMKTALKKSAKVGETVEFEISIHNQGQIAANYIEIADYIPVGTTVTDPNWEQDPIDPQIYTRMLEFPNGFGPGEVFTTTITLHLDKAKGGSYVVNYAEINQAMDNTGRMLSNIDIDSNSDSIKDNDNGGEPGGITDDLIADNGSIDEDDHDPARVYVQVDTVETMTFCLSATTFTNGQFEEHLSFVAPFDEVWYIDFANNIFNFIGAPPTEDPTPFITGPLGYVLSKTPPDENGLSTFSLRGMFIQGTFYNIRLTNGEGAFVQHQGGGDEFNYPELGIIGPNAVCGNGLENYEVEEELDCTYFWEVDPAGGVIVGPDNESSIQVDWNGPNGGPYKLTLTQSCLPDECDAPISIDVYIGDAVGAISCISQLNVSLDADCAVTITPELVLTTVPEADAAYSVMLTDPHGDIIPGNVLTDYHKDMNITVKLIDACSGNSCWGTITVEDKLPPVLQCGDFEMDCFQMETYEPIAYDNCSEIIDIRLIDEYLTPLECHEEYIKEVVRVYVAEDECGNISAECEQTFRLKRLNMDLIVYPESFEISEKTALSCDEVIYNDEGTPDVSVTKVPTLYGKPLYPDFNYYCNIAVDYSDVVIKDFGCNKKFMRTWLVYEAWCSVGEIDTMTQVIEIQDLKDPTITYCPDDIILSTLNAGCTRNVTIPLPEVEDDCTIDLEDFRIDITYPGGFLDSVKTPPTVILDAGVNNIIYRVYDECGNSATCNMNVFIDDENPPVAVCDEFTAIALRSDGSAEAFASIFDDGSYDDCSLKKLLVRKLDNNCPCPTPTFDDHYYLGNYDGHYYYLSHAAFPAHKAKKLAAAHGGYLTNIETPAEHDFIFNAVSNELTDDYYVGLNDLQTEGNFVWGNYTQPFMPPKWDLNQPNGDGDYVIVNSDGKWEDVDGAERLERYVMEISEPCGFSDYISFCCDDVTMIPDDYPMVVLRAVDYFGNYNQCMVTVEVQDKTPPVITVPPDRRIECGTFIDTTNLGLMFGSATATDACAVSIDSTEEVIINTCGVGRIIRTFIASDNNGSTSDTQIITISNTYPFDPETIIFPADTIISDGCRDGDVDPEDLNGYPTYVSDQCDMVGATYSDELFAFAGSDTLACFKLLRTWAVIDWCRMNTDPNYEPAIKQQTIKINNTTPPVIISGCEPDTLFTLDCNAQLASFTAIATDACTPDDELDASYAVDFHSDNVINYEIDLRGNEIVVQDDWPLGCHLIYFTFEDRCGNKTTCAKQVCVVNEKSPTASCIDRLGIALEPMDLDGDNIPDDEMACLFARLLDASSSPACPGDTLFFSFSEDLADTVIKYNCLNIGIDSVTLWVTDQNGNTDVCRTTVEVQDNNNFDFCPDFDLALRKTLSPLTPGPFQPGDDVSFIISLFNQGDFDAFDIQVVDYIPAALELDDNSWSENSGIASYNNNINLLSGASVDISIDFIIDDNFVGTIENAAEISFADSDMDDNNPVPFDTDSSADNDPDNDGNPIDNAIDDPLDEDDHDVEEIEVVEFDLALRKSTFLNCEFEGPGDMGVIQPSSMASSQGMSTFSSGGKNFACTDEGLSFDFTLQSGVESLYLFIDYVIDNKLSEETLIAGGYNLEIYSTGVPDQIRIETESESTIVNMDPELILGSITHAFSFTDLGGGVIEYNYVIYNHIIPISQVILSGTETFNGSIPTSFNIGGGSCSNLADGEDFHNTEVFFGQAITGFVIDPLCPYTNGDLVGFVFAVFNQGTVDATDVVVEDYIPAGMNFVNSSDFSLSGNQYLATIPLLEAGDIAFLELLLEIDANFVGSQLVNSAEIISATNDLGIEDQDDPLGDTNDGSNPELNSDNDIGDNPDNPNDEDDYDPAEIQVLCTVAPVCNVVSNTIKLQLDGNGSATLTTNQVDLGSSAMCNNDPVTLTLSRTSFGCADVGAAFPVTVTVTDNLGNESFCSVMVQVCDEVPPTITCQDVTTGYDLQGMLILTINDVVTASDDNCNINTTVFDLSTVNDNDLMNCIPQMASVIVTDVNGNSTTCSFTITLDDDVPPLCVPNDITINVSDPNTTVTVTSSQVASGSTDGCSGISTITVFPNEFDCNDAGNINIVTITVTDNSGNVSQCTANVSVVDDTTPNCVVQDITVSLTAFGSVIVPASLVDAGSTGGCSGQFTTSISPNTFFCNSAGPNPVTFTLTTSGGAQCTASAIVTVVDSIPPMFTFCPANITVPCGTDISDLSQFGTATATDNCPGTLTVVPNVNPNLNTCDVGVITRTWTASDGGGNTTQCQQVITISGATATFGLANIDWPTTPFIVDDCIDTSNVSGIDTGIPQFIGMFDCANPVFSFVDVDINPQNTNPCNKIYHRNWTVVDSCQLNGLGGGIFPFTQVLELNDIQAPFFSSHPADVTVNLTPPTCVTFVSLTPAVADDFCANPTTITVTNDSNFAMSMASGDASGTYPAGNTLVTFFAEDECGNISSEQTMVSVVDPALTGLRCIKEIAQLGMNLMHTVHVDDFDFVIDSSSNCGPLSYSVSFTDTDPYDSTLVVDCSYLGITYPILYLWAANTQVDTCRAELAISNPTGGCPEPPSFSNGSITGLVFTEMDDPISEVEIELLGSGTPMEYTDPEGEYAFPVMPFGGDYSVLPAKNNDPLNGVSTLDLIGIQQHILGINALDSPYKLIAADIDQSGNVSSIDILELRKLILGIYHDFPNNTSWKMIDAAYSFPDPSNPFVTEFPEEYDIYNLNSDMAIDFVGVKIGDVNNTSVSNISTFSTSGRSDNTVHLITEEFYLEKGINEISFTADQLEILQGFQFTMEFDRNLVEIIDVVPNESVMDKTNFSQNLLEQGLLSSSWHTSEFVENNTEMFRIIVEVNQPSWLSEILDLNSKITMKEAYTLNKVDNLGIIFERSNISEDLILYQNRPNPWIDYTEISFYSNESRNISLKVFDVNAKLLYSQQLLADPGFNTITLNKDDLNGSGVLYYEIISDEERHLKKMISIR